MNINIPVLVTEQKQPDSSATMQTVRPLFFAAPVETAETLQRALNKLANSLRQELETLGANARHDEIARFTFAPALDGKVLNLRVNLGAQNFNCRYFFAALAGFGQKIAFTPNVPDVWFEIARGETLDRRAEAVLHEHFKRLEQRDGRGTQNPELYNFPGKAWLTNLDFDVALPQKYELKEENFFAALGGAGVGNGAEELRQVGRCLDWQFPHDLERTRGRAAEIEKLTRFLEVKDQRPVLIVGKRAVGKTALVHEYVFRAIEKRASPRQPDRNVWLLSPQRLVSGMMYVGQWEERLLAILKEAKERGHLLYFDDLLGLFFAGQSANSDLNMAGVLKPQIEKREIRLLAEITPEALRVLQEKDRGFADLFQILRLDETNDDETLKILLSVRRELEQKYNCRFALDVLPTALDLQRRYVRDAAFPGKAANFLRQLAIKYREKEIARQNVLREFEAKSGMSTAFLDDAAKLERDETVRKIRRGVIGQTAAVEAAADVISIAKARLNDAGRPLASFLFLGATGVGKTEAAKQIAAYLYGDGEKLLRFDMNEFVSPFDAARLVGTFDQPEGLLTGAIRRQPFAVVLLDEIEKAHPDVFNLLLQVMGDGRLTDAHGRTADFTNAIIILTSNLGAREANAKLGFRQTNESDANVFRQAAERFFKPEFFNRLDRVIAFERLRREDVAAIAEKQMQRLFLRDGLTRRNCKLQIEPEAMRRIVDEGYHPQLGARALKRALEKFLTQPIAAALAALSPDAPTIIQVAAVNGKIAARVEEIKPLHHARSVWLTRDFSNVSRELDLIEDALDRIEDKIEPLKPAGESSAHDPAAARYFLIREYIKRVERMIERAENWNAKQIRNPKSEIRNPKRRLVGLREATIDFAELLKSSNLAADLKELAEANPIFGERVEDYLQDIWREVALVDSLAANLDKPAVRRAALVLPPHDEASTTIRAALSLLYLAVFSGELGVQASIYGASENNVNGFSLVVVEGANAFELAAGEIGTHLVVTQRAGFVPIEIRAIEFAAEESADDVLRRAPEIWAENPDQNAPVVRVADGRDGGFGYALDLRTGLLTKNALSVRELRSFVLSGLPIPPELEQL